METCEQILENDTDVSADDPISHGQQLQGSE